MSKPPFKVAYESEAELCSVYMEYATKRGWVAYPETSGYDFILVAGPGVHRGLCFAPGDQIAVQAKLRSNIEVLYQAMPKVRKGAGPNYFAVLLPWAKTEFIAIAHRLGIMYMSGQEVKYDRETRQREWVKSPSGLDGLGPKRRYTFDSQLWTPDFVTDTPAGVKSPRRVTPWKVDAVRLCLKVIAAGGFVMKQDFVEANIDMKVWVRLGWVVAVEKEGRKTKYKLTDKAPHVTYPEVTAAMLASALHT